jgi:NAD(P)-dependent dehydrogenase (short-subunit alcohol dehydrogenase family)
VVIADPGVNLDGSDSTAAPADDVVAEIEAAGGTASAVAVSVTDFEGVGSLIGGVVERYGRLDVVVNNAGITRDRMVVGMEERDWDDVLAVHLKGTFCLTHHAGAHWRALAKAGEKVSGRIINTTSGAGMQGNIGQSAYGTAKAGIAMFTVISSMELEQYGITVNAISPVARTRMTGAVQGFLNEDGDGSFDPFDPANASPIVSYLASERAGWITGQVIRIDGNKLRHYDRWSLSRESYTPQEGRPIRTDEVELGLRALFGVRPLGLGDTRLAED